MMTAWKIAMICLLPIMFGNSKPRAWLAVMGSSMLALIAPQQPIAYLAIDIVCGSLVLVHPAGIAQRAIGLFFAAMAIFDLGYLLSPQADEGTLYFWVLSVLGWAQFAILATWGAYDTGKVVVLRIWPHGNPLATKAGVRWG